MNTLPKLLRAILSALAGIAGSAVIFLILPALIGIVVGISIKAAIVVLGL